MSDHKKIVQFIRELYQTEDFIPLHAPVFTGNEKKYLAECIDTTYVSYVGDFVKRFEKMIGDFTGVKYAIATANGTLALHAALVLAGVRAGDEVITQSLTFVATANPITYCGASPILVDSERNTLGMSPESLKDFLSRYAKMEKGVCVNLKTGKKIAACVPMHVFGHPVRMDEIAAVCREYGIPVIEDAAESLGSFYRKRHTGSFGAISILSFNGNKTITTGGGGMILTNDEKIAEHAKHITTTAKIPHRWEFVHDETGYNYRMPNLNAAVGCAQMENICGFLENKRDTAEQYAAFFRENGLEFVREPSECSSNYWLNAVLFENRKERDEFLRFSNDSGVMTRPAWVPMHKLKMFEHCQKTDLATAEWIEDRLVNLPSSVRTRK